MADKSCFVCLEDFISPAREEILLPCLHSVCSSCITDIISQAVEQNKRPACQLCFENFEKSAITPVTAFRDEKQTCTIHTSHNLTIFCELCRIFVCRTCAFDSHQGHSCLTVDVATKHVLAELQQHLTVLESRLPLFDNAQTDMSVILSTTTVRLTTFTREITTAFNSLIDDLKPQKGVGAQRIAQRKLDIGMRKHALVNIAESQLKADIKTIESQLLAIEIAKDHFVAVQRYITAMQSMNQAGFPKLYNIVLPRIRQLEQANPQLSTAIDFSLRFQFIRPTNLLTCNIEQLGYVGRMRSYSSISQPTHVFGSAGTQPGQFHLPTGIAQLNENHIVVADKSNVRLQVFTLNGTFVRRFAVLFRPCHIAVTTSGDIWIACGSKNAVLCYSESGALLRKIVTATPYSVAVRADKSIVVACGTQRCVKCFAVDGTELWSSTGAGLSFAHGVAVTLRGELVVCDYIGDCVQVLSSTGRFIRYIGQRQLKLPNDVAVISAMDAIVVAEAFQISIWTVAGEFVNRFGSQGTLPGQFDHAWQVAVLHNDQIAVVDRNNHRVQIF